MKMISAIIRHEKLTDVTAALEAAGIKAMTVTGVKGRSTQESMTQQWRGIEYTLDLIEKVKLEIVVTDDLMDKTIDTIMKSAWTGNIGDGKIFVLPVEATIRIRTGAGGEMAV